MSLNQSNAEAFGHAEVQALSKGLHASNPLVLIVEDDEDTRFMLRMMLEMRGFDVVEAADGLEAIEVAVQERPNLILMDGTLPLLDGLSATRRIREYALLRDVPLIALSGHATPAFQAAFFAAGCTDYLVKPFEFVQLDKLLNQYLHRLPNAA